MIDTEQTRKRLVAVQTLLLEPSTTREKFTSVRTLLAGINPKIDEALSGCEQVIATLEKIGSGDVVGLSAEHLPEGTEEEKKRKKYALLFLVNWNKLKSEVVRVQAELAAAQGANTPTEKASHWSRVFRFAKGPFGIITAIAVVGALGMQAVAVDLTIQNKGCGTMQVSSSVPISLPGLKLPTKPIASGGSAVATLPGLTVSVDGTKQGVVEMKVLSFSLTFQLPSNIIDVTLNGESLLGKKTEIRLSERDKHILALTCS